MDRLLGSIIDDYTLYKIIEGIMGFLSLFLIYLSIKIVLIRKSIKKGETNSDELISKETISLENSKFVFIAGFFMILHELLESNKVFRPDQTTFKMLEFLAFTGILLFLFGLYKKLKKLKKIEDRKKMKGDI